MRPLCLFFPLLLYLIFSAQLLNSPCYRDLSDSDQAKFFAELCVYMGSLRMSKYSVEWKKLSSTILTTIGLTLPDTLSFLNCSYWFGWRLPTISLVTASPAVFLNPSWLLVRAILIMFLSMVWNKWAAQVKKGPLVPLVVDILLGSHPWMFSRYWTQERGQSPKRLKNSSRIALSIVLSSLMHCSNGALTNF